MEDKDYSRRNFIKNSFGVFCGGALFLCGCKSKEPVEMEEKNETQTGTKESCSDLSGLSQEDLDRRQQLGYVSESPNPENHCGNCGLYIPPTTENDCGKCLLFKGPVEAGGYCVQYTPKVE